jgi:hypothetical protein
MISDKVHEQRLQKKDALIETDYYDRGAVRIRRSDHTKTDDVNSGVILAKKYYMHGKLMHQETEFNPGMLYSFIFPATEDGRVQCPNCGGIGEDALFSDGCPYCGAFYNMDYQKELPGGRDHSDYVVQERKGLLLPLVLIMAVCIVAGMIITVTTGRTSTVFDYGKGALIGGIAGGVIYLIYSGMKYRASLTSKEVKKKHEQDIVMERFLRDLQANGLSMGTFVNNLNLGLRDYYFGSDTDETRNIIDFDVLDYRGQNLTAQDGKVYVTTDVSIRLVSGEKDKVWSDETVKRIRLKKSGHAGLHQKAGLNLVKCPFCGASIDLQAKRCSYCGTAFLYERPLNIESVSTLPGSS